MKDNKLDFESVDSKEMIKYVNESKNKGFINWIT